MQRLLGAVLFVALSAAIALAQQPPPGADQIGSDHRVGQQPQRKSDIVARMNSQKTSKNRPSPKHRNSAAKPR